MKGILVSINLIISLMSLATDQLGVAIICVCYFAFSVGLYKYACRKGWFDEIKRNYEKRLKANRL